MARSIGRRNINLVALETERAIKETGNYQVEQLVIDRLDEDLWDTWEGADAEIRRIISDTIMKER